MADLLQPKNLVRWLQAGGDALGVVVENDGRTVTVRLDEDGSKRNFACSAGVIEHVVLEPGQHVRVVSSGEIGVVQTVFPYKGLTLYKVGLSGGQTPTVVEDGIRPAVLTDPIERLRAGELHSAQKTNLRIAATRLLFGYQHDELSTLGNSRVELKPHQVGVVHRVANAYPHRFILADEVGLGKTIEAGLLIRELLARGTVRRVLILTPSGLVGQWQHEIKTKFNLSFSLYNGDSIRWLQNEHPNENPWTLKDTVIASTTYASYDPQRWKEIADAGWDMIVVDEAHHVRRTRQAATRTQSTKLYRLVSQLSDPELTRAQSMLLLTATPMQLDPYELYSLIELLDPALFPTEQDFTNHRRSLRGLNETVEKIKRWPTLSETDKAAALEAAEHWLGADADELRDRADHRLGDFVDELEGQHRLSRVMVRNRKRVVGGFMPRVAAIWEVHLTEQEREAHDAVERYLMTGYARSKVTQNNALGFLMSTFQKMNASSSNALRRSLERRIEKLESVTAEQHRETIIEEAAFDEKLGADALDSLMAERVDLDWQEVKELEQLVELLEAIAIDSKTKVLLANLAEIAEREDDPKVIIFTQFRDTQDYLAQHLAARWHVHLFHGGLKPREKDAAVADFRDGSGPRVLITTEAGGEGRNFQFCHILINYDLPWNPMRVEQRIGRIDRIGQPKPVKIFNFATVGSIEERVVEVLTNRIGVFQETIGGLDPILGNVERDLQKIFMAADREAEREIRELGARLEARIADARVAEEQRADLIMDTRSYRRDEVEMLLQRPAPVKPRDVQSFVLGALKDMGVRIDRDEEHAGVFALRLNTAFDRHFPDESRAGRERRVTFDLSTALAREEIEFLAFGHPIVDGLIELLRREDFGGITSHRTVLSDEVDPARGWLFVYEISLSGMETTRELLPVFIHEDGREDDDVARFLLDRAMTGRREDFPETSSLPERAEAFETSVSAAEAAVVMRMLSRQEDVERDNAVRLEDERRKQERFFDYRAQAAADKVAATHKTVERLRQSVEDDERRILPVWEKNLENAKAMLESVEEERRRRLDDLDGRDSVTVQHQLLAASYVSIEPDPAPLFAQVQAALTPSMYAHFKRLCVRTTAEQLLTKRAAVAKRREELRRAATRLPFDLETAAGIADALLAALDELDRLTAREINLLSGAVEYFLLIDDEDHDLNSPDGFEDDRLVANIVLGAIGLPELAVQAANAAAVS